MDKCTALFWCMVDSGFGCRQLMVVRYVFCLIDQIDHVD
jgi:hypothetical protein